jgi:hypothetical protein
VEGVVGVLSARKKKRVGNNALDTEMKIELPGRHLLRVVAVFVGERESDLDDLEEVHVTAHRLIVVV